VLARMLVNQCRGLIANILHFDNKTTAVAISYHLKLTKAKSIAGKSNNKKICIKCEKPALGFNDFNIELKLTPFFRGWMTNRSYYYLVL